MAEYNLSDLMDKKLRFTKETDFWYLNFATGKREYFKRSPGTEYYCYSYAYDPNQDGKVILQLYPIGNQFLPDYTVNLIYPGINSGTVNTIYDADRLDKQVLYLQGVKTIQELYQDEKDKENQKSFLDQVKTLAKWGIIFFVGSKIYNTIETDKLKRNARYGK